MKTKKIFLSVLTGWNLDFPTEYATMNDEISRGIRISGIAAIVFLISFSHLLFANSFSVGNTKVAPALQQQAQQWMQNHPVKFIENKGQMTDMKGNPVPFVLFKTAVPAVDLYITEKGITYLFVKAVEEKKTVSNWQLAIGSETEDNKKTEWERIDMELKGAAIKRENIIKETSSVTDFNFFLSHCPNGIYGVKEYEKIIVKEIYPGIDWILYNAEGKGFKYDFIIHPGADHKQIRILYSSLSPLILNKEGNIEIPTELGILCEQVPYSYIQETNRQVTSHYQITETKKHKEYYQTTLTFKVSEIDFFSEEQISEESQTLVIDPLVTPVLTWGTYYGGNFTDDLCSIATDANGNLFVTGYTQSSNFPTLNAGGGSYFKGVKSSEDVFILKFTNAGVRIWATYYGGSGFDLGHSIAIDGNGNLFITGYTTSTDFPTQGSGGYFQSANAGGQDAFILKFTNAGVRQWATYYGGSGQEGGNLPDAGISVCIDPSGNTIITGMTYSSDIPLLNPAGGAYFQNTNVNGDAFILKFNNTDVLVWATYYGGSGADFGLSLSIDISGNIFITGYTFSVNFPTLQLAGAYWQPAKGSGADVFVLKFTNTGICQWATYYGGSGFDYSNSIATDINGNVFITGYTYSVNFPTYNPGGGVYFQAANAGKTDIFILKFDNAGVRLWATYYGGSEDDQHFMPNRKNAIITDASGDVFVTGLTYSNNFPRQNSGGYYKGALSGQADVFILQFSNTGIRKWATYSGTSGGGGNDFGVSLAIDPGGCLFSAGEWRGTGSNALADPGGGAYYIPAYFALDDSYIMKFCSPPSVLSTTAVSTNILCNGQCTGTATANPSGGTGTYTYNWFPGGGTNAMNTGLCAGTYTVTVTDTVPATATATVTITQPDLLTVTAAVTNSTCGNNNGIAIVNAGGGTPGYTYSWNPFGGTNAAATGLGTGNYTATITDANGCTTTQTVSVVSSGSVITTSQSASVCSGSTYTLPGGTIVSTGGTYIDTLTSTGGCDSIITTNLTVNPNPTATAFSNTTITQGQSVTLTASGGGIYSWSPAASGTNGSSITVAPPVTTLYCVTVTDTNNCTDSACVTVTIEQIDCSGAGEIYLPNAFSPNGDGENDKLQIYYGNPTCIKDFKLVIYNRWGEKVFETTNPIAEWDGFYNGKPENASVFVYYMEATLISGEEIIKKRNISLIK